MEQQTRPTNRERITSDIRGGLNELIKYAEQLAPIIGDTSEGGSDIRFEMRVIVDADKSYAKLPASFSAYIDANGEWFDNSDHEYSPDMRELKHATRA